MNIIELFKKDSEYFVKHINAFREEEMTEFSTLKEADKFANELMNYLATNNHSFSYVDATIAYHIKHDSEILADEIINSNKTIVFDDEEKLEEYVDNNDNWRDFHFNWKVNKGYVLLENK